MIKRSFFARGTTSHTLDNVIVALKGVYTSIRLCDVSVPNLSFNDIKTNFQQPKSSVGGPSTGLALNVDVANGTFWTAQDVHQAARNLCSRRNRNLDYNVFTNLVAPAKNNTKNTWEKTEEFKDLAKMVKLRFTVKHRGKNDGMSKLCFRSSLLTSLLQITRSTPSRHSSGRMSRAVSMPRTTASPGRTRRPVLTWKLPSMSTFKRCTTSTFNTGNCH